MARNLLQSLTVLTEDDDVSGSKFESDPQEYTVDQLKRWLKCRVLKLSGKRDDLLKSVSDCIQCGSHHTLDASIDNGKWCAAKVLKESPQIQATSSSTSLQFIPSTVTFRLIAFLLSLTLTTCITSDNNGVTGLLLMTDVLTT